MLSLQAIRCLFSDINKPFNYMSSRSPTQAHILNSRPPPPPLTTNLWGKPKSCFQRSKTLPTGWCIMPTVLFGGPERAYSC